MIIEIAFVIVSISFMLKIINLNNRIEKLEKEKEKDKVYIDIKSKY